MTKIRVDTRLRFQGEDMQIRISEDLVAPCGIYCGVCKYYLSRVRGRYKSKKSGCEGCIPRDEGCNFRDGCEPLNTKAVRFCFECADFPCETTDRLEKRYARKYRNSLIDNLTRIKESGIEQFLQDEDQRWKCQE